MVENKSVENSFYLFTFSRQTLALPFFLCYTEAMRKYFNHKIKKAIIVDSLITIESLQVSSGFTYPAETHDFYEFAYIDNGAFCCHSEQETVQLFQGECLLIPPHKEHYYTAMQSHSANVFIVCFRSNAEILTVFDKKISLGKELKSLLAEIVQESKNAFSFPFNRKLKLLDSPLFGAQQLVENNLEKLFIQLVRKEIQKNENIRFVMNSTELENNLVHDILVLLQEHVHGRITLDEICQQTFYSKTFLNSIFKKSTGYTLNQYINYKRLLLVRELHAKGQSLLEASTNAGFNNYSHFYRMYVKENGKPPKYME